VANPRDRDELGRAKNARPRDELGRPLPRESENRLAEELLPDDPDELLRIGTEHFNARRFFQAHETWETAWHPSPEPERDFWQGITQIAVGFTHFQRGNARGAVTLLRRGARRLIVYGDSYRGFPAADLAGRAREAADEIERSEASAQPEFPTITLEG
jgi:uncharacterized protein